ncbi:sigma 54-interacting transcriptional regulator [Virgibacillus sp. FSP13]
MITLETYTVENWMNKDLETIDQTMTIHDVMQLLGESGKTELPVVEGKSLIGVVRLKECMDGISNGLAIHDPIKTIMSLAWTSVNKDLPITELVEIPLYVVEGEEEKLVGEITEEELFAYHKAMIDDIKQKKELVEWFELCFDTAYEGLVVVDEKGVIQLFNETYSRFVGVTKEEAIGKRADQVIDRTRLPIVLKTGVPERSQAHRLQGQNLVVHRLPIWKDNRVIGAVGMLVYEGISELYQVIDRMERLDDIKSQKKLVEIPCNMNDVQVHFEDILGESLVISETKKIARKAAQSRATVLITGDSGVGKEQFARAIHDTGITNQGKFISVNCAAIPDNLLESELFGYAKGAFTGANKDGKAGKFELAHDGTLFLDEIGDMPMAMQAKILRVLQEKKVERVGGTTSIPVNFRLITATNKDLKQLVERKEFREDLYYRLYVIPIHIPPLRDRKQDIPVMVSHKLQQLAEAYGVTEKTIDKQILRNMYNYDWPGNVRELMNVLERLFVLTDEDHINVKNVPIPLFAKKPGGEDQPHKKIGRLNRHNDEVVLEEEKDAIEMALKQVQGNKSKAAKLLGISRATLYNKLSRFQLMGDS